MIRLLSDAARLAHTLSTAVDNNRRIDLVVTETGIHVSGAFAGPLVRYRTGMMVDWPLLDGCHAALDEAVDIVARRLGEAATAAPVITVDPAPPGEPGARLHTSVALVALGTLAFALWAGMGGLVA